MQLQQNKIVHALYYPEFSYALMHKPYSSHNVPYNWLFMQAWYLCDYASKTEITQI